MLISEEDYNSFWEWMKKYISDNCIFHAGRPPTEHLKTSWNIDPISRKASIQPRAEFLKTSWNIDLREDKSWSYGVRTRLSDAKGQRAMLVTAPVQTDKTSESMSEIIKEYDAYLSTNMTTDEELAKGKASKTLRLPGQFETLGALKSGVSNIVIYNRDLNYLNQLMENVNFA